MLCTYFKMQLSFFLFNSGLQQPSQVTWLLHQAKERSQIKGKISLHKQMTKTAKNNLNKVTTSVVGLFFVM